METVLCGPRGAPLPQIEADKVPLAPEVRLQSGTGGCNAPTLESSDYFLRGLPHRLSPALGPREKPRRTSSQLQIGRTDPRSAATRLGGGTEGDALRRSEAFHSL